MTHLLRNCLTLAMFSTAAVSRFVAADPTTAPASSPRIHELIAQLGGANPQVCLRAEHALIRIGRIAKPALREAMKSHDPEVVLHASYTLGAIDDPLTPTYVTLDVDNAPLDQVLASLAEQTELSISLFPADANLGETRITLHVKEEPLLGVFAQLGEQANLSATIKDGAWTLRKGNGTWSRDHSSVQGPICIHLFNIMRQISASYGTPPVFHTSVLVVSGMSSEGKARIIGLQNARVTRCVDGAGHPMDVSVQTPLATSLNFDIHGHPVEPLQVIEGVVDVVIGARQEPIEIAEIETAKEVKRVAGNLRLTFETCRETAEKRWSARFQIFRDGRADLVWEQLKQGLKNQPPILKDVQGRPLDNWGGSEVLKDNGDQVEIEFHYANFRDLGRGIPDRPVSLSWNIQTLPKTVPVSFSFKNVPIP